MLREFFGAEHQTPAKEQLVQLESALELAGLKPAEALPLVAPMLIYSCRRNIQRCRFRPSNNVANCWPRWSNGY